MTLKDDLMFGTKHSPNATWERLLCSILHFYERGEGVQGVRRFAMTIV